MASHLSIGFSNVYYTLWLIDEPVRHHINEWQYYDVVYYQYIQNLSMDKNRALEKAREKGCENLIVNFELGGHISYEKKSQIVTTTEDWQFPYGKIIGEDVRISNDVWQLERMAHSTIEYPITSQYAIDRLIELGNHVLYEDELITKADYESRISSIAERAERDFVTNKALKDGYIEFEPSKNITYSTVFGMTYLLYNDNRDYLIIPNSIPSKVMYYQEYEYWLPIINGKAKRIKGKMIRVNVLNALKSFQNNLDEPELLLVASSIEFVKGSEPATKLKTKLKKDAEKALEENELENRD